MTYCFHLKYIIAFILFGSDNVGCQSYCFKWLRNYTNHNSNRRFVLSSTFLLQKWTWFFILFGIAIRPSWLFLYETYYQIGVNAPTLVSNCESVIVILLSPFVFHQIYNHF